MESLCPWKVLGIGFDASAEDIRRAWRRLSLDCHPDKRPGDPTAGAKFAALTHARDCLLDPQRCDRSASEVCKRSRKRQKASAAGCWGETRTRTTAAASGFFGPPSSSVMAARRAAAAANKKVLETVMLAAGAKRKQTSQDCRQDVEDQAAALTSQHRKAAKLEAQIRHAEAVFQGERSRASQDNTRESDGGMKIGPSGSWSLRHQSSVRHPERLLSFENISDGESISDASSSDDSSVVIPETTALDAAFGHARESWQADTLLDAGQAPRRFLILMPAPRLRSVRPDQYCSVLFAFDYMSKVLYEYLPDEQTCVALWSPIEPDKNAEIWTVLPLPPAWLRKARASAECSSGHFEFTLPAGCLSRLRPGHDEASQFTYDVETKTLHEFWPEDGTFRVVWVPSDPSVNALIWTVLPLPPEQAEV